MESILKLKSSQDQTVVEVKEVIKNFSTVINEANEEDDTIELDLSGEVLVFLKNFFEAHSYDISSMNIVTPLTSCNLKDHIDPISFELFKDLEYLSTETEEQNEQRVAKLNQLVKASYYLNIENFKKVCLITLGCPFYVGPTEDEIKKYREKWNLEEMTPEEERQLIEENQPIFDKINEKFRELMKQEEEEFLKAAEEQEIQ